MRSSKPLFAAPMASSAFTPDARDVAEVLAEPVRARDRVAGYITTGNRHKPCACC